MWLAPPAMNSCTTRLARGLKCGAALASIADRAMPPRPPPLCQRNSRRESITSSIDKGELVQVEEQPAQIRQPVAIGVLRQRIELRRARRAAERQPHRRRHPARRVQGHFLDTGGEVL